MILTIENIISSSEKMKLHPNCKQNVASFLKESSKNDDVISSINDMFNKYRSNLKIESNGVQIPKELFIFEMMLLVYSDITSLKQFSLDDVFNTLDGHYSFITHPMSNDDFICFNLLFGDQKKMSFNDKITEIVTDESKVGVGNRLFSFDHRLCTLLDEINDEKEELLFSAYSDSKLLLNKHKIKKKSFTLITDLLSDDKYKNKPISSVSIVTTNNETLVFDICGFKNIKDLLEKYYPSQLTAKYDTFPATSYAKKMSSKKKKNFFDFENGKKEMFKENPHFHLGDISVKEVVENKILGDLTHIDLSGTKNLLGKTGSGKSRITHLINQDFAKNNAKVLYLTSDKQETIELAYQAYRESNGSVKPLVIQSSNSRFAEYYKPFHDFRQAKLMELYKNKNLNDQDKREEKKKIEDAINFISSPYEPNNSEFITNLLMHETFNENRTKTFNGINWKDSFFVDLKSSIRSIEITFFDRTYQTVSPVTFCDNAMKVYKTIPDADVIFINYKSFLMTKLPFQFDIHERTMYEFFSDIVDLIIVDESDHIMQNFDNTFNKEMDLLNSQHDLKTVIDLSLKVLSSKNKETTFHESRSMINKVYRLSKYSSTEFFKIVEKPEMKRFLNDNGQLFDLYKMISYFFSKYTKKTDSKNNSLYTYMKMFFSNELKHNPAEFSIYHLDDLTNYINEYDELRIGIVQSFKRIYSGTDESGEDFEDDDFIREENAIFELMNSFVSKLISNEEIVLKENYVESKAPVNFLIQLMYFAFYDYSLREIYVDILYLIEREAQWLKDEEDTKKSAARLAASITDNYNNIRSYIPKSILKVRMNYKFEEDDQKTEMTSEGKKNKRVLKLLVNSYVGRNLLFGLFDLFYRKDRETLPNTLLMSATSYLPGASKNHVDVPVSYVVHNENQKDMEISFSLSPIPVVSNLMKGLEPEQTHYCVSGTPQYKPDGFDISLPLIKIREMAKDMYSHTLNFEESFSYLEETKKTFGYSKRQIIGIVCSSYVSSEYFYKGLKEQMAKDHSKENFNFVYLGRLEKDGTRKDGVITKNELSELGEKDIDVLIFPQSVLSRGKNILIPGEKNSLIGKMILTTRTMPIPNDFNNTISYIHAHSKEFYEKSLNITRDLAISPYQMMKNLIDSTIKFKNVSDSRFNYLDEELQKNISYNILGDLTQVFGRGTRNGTKLSVDLCDGVFSKEIDHNSKNKEQKNILDYWAELSEDEGLINYLYSHITVPIKKMLEEDVSRMPKAQLEFTF